MQDEIEQRPIPVLIRHFPSTICIDFDDVNQRWWCQCSCGVVFRSRDVNRVKENWAFHATSRLPAHDQRVRNEALEEAAKVAEWGATCASKSFAWRDIPGSEVATRIAAAIRAKVQP